MISIAAITCLNEIGGRPNLEDAVFPLPGNARANDRLFMVCDGVGGERRGEEASRIACEAFAAYFATNPPGKEEVNNAYLSHAHQYAINQMQAFISDYPDARGMSTTLTLAYIGNDHIVAAWCGDSRIYHLRNGKVLWHSADHSLVNLLVQRGEITAEEAAVHPRRNVITRCLNISNNLSEIETHRLSDIRTGDHILLCTDGLLEQISEARLQDILESNDPDKAALFQQYCRDRTRDNYSMYLLQLNMI